MAEPELKETMASGGSQDEIDVKNLSQEKIKMMMKVRLP